MSSEHSSAALKKQDFAPGPPARTQHNVNRGNDSRHDFRHDSRLRAGFSHDRLPAAIRSDVRQFAVSVLESECLAIDRMRRALQRPDASEPENHRENESVLNAPHSYTGISEATGISESAGDYEKSVAESDCHCELGDQFDRAVDAILNCRGNLILCGIGKAGWIAQKLSATFASTGTPSHFLHPSEAIHGDLGRLTEHDIPLVLSHSGQTSEITRILPALEVQTGGILSITANPGSTLAMQSTIPLVIPKMSEACANGLAPSTSTTAMLALGDALALTVSRIRGFTKQDFARFHPGGSLGMQLAKVDEVMRPLTECRVGHVTQTIGQTLIEASRPGRRTGAIMLVDDEERLCGIFTDSDLARLLEKQAEDSLAQPVESIMTRQFRAVHSGAQLVDAVAVLTELKISELPVIDQDDRPLGMIDITDVVSLANQSKSDTESPYGKHQTDPSPVEPTIIRLFKPNQQ